MKARIKSTGVLVDVTPQLNINSQHNNNYLYVCDNMVYRECELDFFSETIDWEQRRYELAKDIIKAVVADDCGGNSDAIAKYAVNCADALIKRLKEVNNE
jgi:hypothetical protein|nr:MAG TPA: hypothetical protein [Caudoviricetes sp.]